MSSDAAVDMDEKAGQDNNAGQEMGREGALESTNSKVLENMNNYSENATTSSESLTILEDTANVSRSEVGIGSSQQENDISNSTLVVSSTEIVSINPSCVVEDMPNAYLNAITNRGDIFRKITMKIDNFTSGWTSAGDIKILLCSSNVDHIAMDLSEMMKLLMIFHHNPLMMEELKNTIAKTGCYFTLKTRVRDLVDELNYLIFVLDRARLMTETQGHKIRKVIQEYEERRSMQSMQILLDWVLCRREIHQIKGTAVQPQNVVELNRVITVQPNNPQIEDSGTACLAVVVGPTTAGPSTLLEENNDEQGDTNVNSDAEIQSSSTQSEIDEGIGSTEIELSGDQYPQSQINCDDTKKEFGDVENEEKSLAFKERVERLEQIALNTLEEVQMLKTLILGSQDGELTKNELSLNATESRLSYLHAKFCKYLAHKRPSMGKLNYPSFKKQLEYASDAGKESLQKVKEFHAIVELELKILVDLSNRAKRAEKHE